MLGPWVMQVKLLLHHLEGMACELNLSALLGARAIIMRQYSFSLLFALSSGVQLIQSTWFIAVLSLELALLSWDNTHSVCTLHSHLEFIIQSVLFIVVLSLELARLSWHNTHSVCALHSHLGFAHSIYVIYIRALFGAFTSKFKFLVQKYNNLGWKCSIFPSSQSSKGTLGPFNVYKWKDILINCT